MVTLGVKGLIYMQFVWQKFRIVVGSLVSAAWCDVQAEALDSLDKFTYSSSVTTASTAGSETGA